MKLAAIHDVWRALRKTNNRKLNRLSVSWSGIPRLSDGKLNITNPITLICGENGAGKSSILHVLVHAIASGELASTPMNYCRPNIGVLESIEIEVIDVEVGAKVIVGAPDVKSYFFPRSGTALFAFLDVGMHVPAMLEMIKRDTNFSDFLEGVDPVILSAEVLEHAKFIIGRQYSKIYVYEISGEGTDDIWPYFRVESHGVTYDTSDMGYGEISVIYMLWSLGRLGPGALLLVEEPETFLSPRAQTALVDVIAVYAKKNNVSVIMTSHSGAIAARMTNEEIIYATRSVGKVVLHNPARTSDLIERLGLVPDKVFIFFVEDQVAEIMARVLIDNFSYRLSASSEYIISQGEANVLRAISVISPGIRQVAHIGVLDGDQRDIYKGGDARIVFLPGTTEPETLLRNFVENLTHEDFARLLGVNEDGLSRARAHADGEELHNWWHTLANNLKIPFSELIRRVASRWAEINQVEANRFVAAAEKFSSAKSGV